MVIYENCRTTLKSKEELKLKLKIAPIALGKRPTLVYQPDPLLPIYLHHIHSVLYSNSTNSLQQKKHINTCGYIVPPVFFNESDSDGTTNNWTNTAIMYENATSDHLKDVVKRKHGSVCLFTNMGSPPQTRVSLSNFLLQKNTTTTTHASSLILYDNCAKEYSRSSYPQQILYSNTTTPFVHLDTKYSDEFKNNYSKSTIIYDNMGIHCNRFNKKDEPFASSSCTPSTFLLHTFLSDSPFSTNSYLPKIQPTKNCIGKNIPIPILYDNIRQPPTMCNLISNTTINESSVKCTSVLYDNMGIKTTPWHRDYLEVGDHTPTFISPKSKSFLQTFCFPEFSKRTMFLFTNSENNGLFHLTSNNCIKNEYMHTDDENLPTLVVYNNERVVNM